MEQYSNSATRQFLNAGSRFGGWSAECVGAFIGDLAAGRAGAHRWLAMLTVDTDRADLFVRRRGKLTHLATFGNAAAQIAAGVRQKLRKAERQALVVRLGGRRAIVKPVTLPEGARAVAAAIVRNKVESLAPWPVEDAIWGHRLAGAPQDGQFTVEVGIAGRKPLDALLAALAGAGVRVTELDIGDGAEDPNAIAIDFQSDHRRAKARAAVRSVMWGIGFFAAAIGGYGVWMAAAAHFERAGIEARTAELTAALRSQPTGTANSGKVAEAAKAVDRKRSELPVMVILNTLTAQVPDNAWLNAVDYADGRLTMAGRGVSISGIIANLESSDIFSSVNFAAPTQRDREANADIFSISALVEANSAAPQ